MMTGKTPYPLVRPAADVVDTERGLQIMVNMPGVTEKDLHWYVQGQQLHIKACSHCPIPQEYGKDVRNLEFGNVEFSLDIAVNAILSAPIHPHIDNGVLSVFLPCRTDCSDSPVVLY